MRPLPIAAAERRGLIVEAAFGIRTFSNGSEHERWADGNCWSCRYYDEADACAFADAALLGLVSPALAVLFGWTQDAAYDTPSDHRSGG